MKNKLGCYIVDDQPASVNRLLCLLEKCDGVRVIGSNVSSRKAIPEILSRKPEVVFLDIEMPGLSGFEMIEHIRRNHFFPQFVFTTGYSQYAIKAIKARAYDYLLKPIDLDELKKTLSGLFPSEKLNHLLQHLELSKREKEIVEMILKGLSTREIADHLFISKNTVNTHRRNLLERNHFKNTRDLLLYFNAGHSDLF